MEGEQGKLQQIATQISSHLGIEAEDSKYTRHMAGILHEEPPINGAQLYQIISDFLQSFKIPKHQALKKCQHLYEELRKKQMIKQENKFSLSSDKLDEVLVLENILSMQDARQPLFAKKPTAGNSNTQMRKWKKKDKTTDKQKEKAMLNFEKHMNQIEKKKKQLPPVQIRRQREGTGSNDLILDNISLIIAGKTLLEATNIKLAYGRKYGLVGRNGIGKTCLMNALARGEFPKMPKHLQILLVQQEIRNTSKSALQTVLQTDVQRERLLLEVEQLEQKQTPDALKKLTEIYKRLQIIEANKAQAKASTILGGLGFTQQMMQKPVGSLSGGWRMRVALARALFVQPDILLLDEPTNHLDLDAVMWLEDYITNCKNTVVIVSHARQFLNVTCNEIIHFYNQKLDYYRGNYDIFQKVRIENRQRQKKAFESQQMKLEHMQDFIDKFRFNAKRASLVQSRIKAINKMQLVQEVIEDPSCVFIFPSPDKLRPPLLRIQDGYFTYDQNQQTNNYILRNINFAVDMESRIAIVGANGVGKSTLLKLLVGSLQLSSGNSYRNGRLSLSMFTQHHVDQLKLHLSPLEQFMEDFPGSSQETYRSHLGSFGITGMLALRPNYLLSGGQKSRVAFALSMWKNPHILVLDEPTNHLDIDAVNALIIALNNYSGGVIIVSHDQHLISTVCDQIWYIKDTRLKKFNGDFEDYRRKLATGKL